MQHLTILIAAASLSLAGCGMNPGTVAGPVPVKGRATFANGVPIKDVVLTLQPLERGRTMAGLKVGADGSFSGQAIPGTYTYYFSAQEGRSAHAAQKFAERLKPIPAEYRSPHVDRQIRVGSGELVIRLSS